RTPTHRIPLECPVGTDPRHPRSRHSSVEETIMLRKSSLLWAAALGLTLALASPSWAQRHQSHGGGGHGGGHGVPVRSSAPAVHHGSVNPHTFSGVPHSAGVYRGSAVPQHWAAGNYGSRYNHAGTWHNGLYGNHYAYNHHYPYYGRHLYSP